MLKACEMVQDLSSLEPVGMFDDVMDDSVRDRNPPGKVKKLAKGLQHKRMLPESFTLALHDPTSGASKSLADDMTNAAAWQVKQESRHHECSLPREYANVSQDS